MRTNFIRCGKEHVEFLNLLVFWTLEMVLVVLNSVPFNDNGTFTF